MFGAGGGEGITAREVMRLQRKNEEKKNLMAKYTCTKLHLLQ